MEFFKTLLFGVTGVSLIFWVAVIALWHTYMFPRFFREDMIEKNLSPVDAKLFDTGLKPSGLIDRRKYSRKSFVIADFSPVEPGYGVNRLFVTVLMSLGFMSFILITYGLHSGFGLLGGI